MLRLEHLTIRQAGFALTADLTAELGQIIAVMGPSGAGKSTLLSALAGFLPPVGGRILWQGADITQADPAKRPIAMMFQDHNLLPHLSASQNVSLGIRPNLRLDAREKEQVKTALDHVGLSGLEARKPAQLSGGQQGRVALARVMVQSRPILALDEPFAALGPALRAEMLDMVANLARDSGALVLMVTHLPDDAARIADQIIMVAEGQAHPPQDAKTLLANPPPALRRYLGHT